SQGPAQLSTDAKSRGLRWLGALARNGFVSKKALDQMARLWKTHDFLFPEGERCTQFGLGLVIAATTANTVAVFRTFPEIDISASVMGGYCSASVSRRALTPWRLSTSLTMASKPMGIPLFERNLKSGRISDVTNCNVIASPTTRTSSPSNWVMRIIPA